MTKDVLCLENLISLQNLSPRTIMKILVVEDDQKVAQALQILLYSYHYAVDIAVDGEEGMRMADTFDYDLVLLDIALPRLDGISLCQKLRAKGFQVPVLLLTGQDGGHQKAIALNAGADDYVVKPFDAEELIARVQALLRRGGPKTQPILVWGDLSINPSSRQVTYGTHHLSMRPKEYAILELFLRNSQTVFSAKAILDQAWRSLESPGEEAVRVHIKELRKKFNAVGAPDDFIKTIYRTGYCLNPLYAKTLASSADEQPATPHNADLKAVNEELHATLSEMQSAHAELEQENHTLAIAYQTLQQEAQQLRLASNGGVPPIDTQDIAHQNGKFTSIIAESEFPLNAIIRKPLVVSTKATMMDAIAQMSSRHHDQFQGAQSSCVMVLEDELLVGILTQQDVVRLSAQQQPLDYLIVGQVMSQPVVVLRQTEFTSVESALHLLQQHQIHHLPILDEQGRLVGVVTYESLWSISQAQNCGH